MLWSPGLADTRLVMTRMVQGCNQPEERLFLQQKEKSVFLHRAYCLPSSSSKRSQYIGILAASHCSFLQRGAVGCFAAWTPRHAASFPRDSDCTSALRLPVMCHQTSPQRERHRHCNMALLTLYISGRFGREINSKCTKRTSSSGRSLLH